MFKDQDKDLSSKDKDCIDKDQDKDCILVLKESLRTKTRTNITELDRLTAWNDGSLASNETKLHNRTEVKPGFHYPS